MIFILSQEIQCKFVASKNKLSFIVKSYAYLFRDVLWVAEVNELKVHQSRKAMFIIVVSLDKQLMRNVGEGAAVQTALTTRSINKDELVGLFGGRQSRVKLTS